VGGLPLRVLGLDAELVCGAVMPRVEFVESLAGPAASIELPEGGRLRDACDQAAAPVPFSCRATSCGTCRIDVLAGAELLEPAGEDERAVLAIFGDDPTTRRLACTAQVRPLPGLLRIRACQQW
jgi:ferredoxin